MKRKTSFTLSTFIILTLCVSMGVSGASTLKNITAQLNYGMQMKLDNQPFNPKDADGTELRPIVYNNRTYLPVRALGEALGLAIGYDNATSTVLLGKTNGTPITNKHFNGSQTYYDYTTNSNLLSTGGRLIEYGFVTKDVYSNDLDLNPDGKFQFIEASIYSQKGCLMIIKDNATGEIFDKIEMKENDWTEISVDIKGAKIVKLSLEAAKDQKIIFGEPIFK